LLHYFVAIPFKWGQVFQLLRRKDLEETNVVVAIPFKWGQVFQPEAWSLFGEAINKVAIPFKWGQVFQQWIEISEGGGVTMSQSLLNEVKYSNEEKRGWWIYLSPLSQSLLNEVKYSNRGNFGWNFLWNWSRNPF